MNPNFQRPPNLRQTQQYQAWRKGGIHTIEQDRARAARLRNLQQREDYTQPPKVTSRNAEPSIGGLVLGAGIIGGMLGGPVGAVIGGVLGGLYGMGRKR